MPLGFERINERQQRPNSLINFIKPLEGPDKAIALDFLNRIAAICYPVMAQNHIAVMSLEEYEPNMEFVGRNFNAGEVIQLVLKAPYSGHWLPFRHVQMLMMHELAHCKQMNHSGAFWKVRNQYAAELRALWTKSYVGEGMWGRGRMLANGDHCTEANLSSETQPSALCGGTYRWSRRKRKRGKGDAKTAEKPKISYAERQQRRIARKFGKAGMALGADEKIKSGLEQKKSVKGKPRVANSIRGRELRAAAALARFEKKEEDDDLFAKAESGSETDSDFEDIDINSEALDIDGARMTDMNGGGMVKVCEGEDGDDVQVKREMDEMRELDSALSPSIPGKLSARASMPTSIPEAQTKSTSSRGSSKANDLRTLSINRPKVKSCPLCSFDNEPNTPTCSVCSHVLNASEMRDIWRCSNQSCKKSGYANSNDASICGLCGQTRLSAP